MENKMMVMRRALRDVSRVAEEMTRGTITGESVDRETVDAWAMRLCEIVSRDLAIPLRQCDVGSPEEQVERFKEYCQSNMQYYRDMFGTHDGAEGWDCREDCLIGKMIDKNDSLCDHCQLVWAHTPYEAQEGGRSGSDY